MKLEKLVSVRVALLVIFCAVLFSLSGIARGEPLLPRDPSLCYEAYWLRPGVNQGLVILNAESRKINAYVVYYDHFVRWYFGEGVPTVWSGTLEPGVPYAVAVEPGTYVLVLYPTECDRKSNVYGWVWYMAPVGVSSLYPVNTSGVLGYFRIDSIRAYYAGSMFEEGQEMATLQLNSVLELRTSEGSTEYFALQMVLDFLTKKGRFRAVTNIWSLTSDLAYYDVRGRGAVASRGGVRWYYSNSEWLDYKLPLEGFLYHRVDLRRGEVSVHLGVILLSGSKEGFFLWLDNITIGIRQEGVSVVDAHIATSSRKLASYKPGWGYSLNVELVFGGGAAGEPTQFRDLNAKLAIFYLQGGLWKPFPELYNFGLLTAEGATNLGTSLDSSGLVKVYPVSKPSFGLIAKSVNPRVAGVASPLLLVQQYDRTGGLSQTTLSESPMDVCYEKIIPLSNAERYYLGNVSLETLELLHHWSNSTTVKPAVDGCVSLKPPAGGLAFVKTRPVYVKQYLVKVFPHAEVDGAKVENGSLWVNAGRRLSVRFPREVTLANGTKLVLSDEAEKEVVISTPTSIEARYRRLYYVSIVSRFPVAVNSKTTATYADWVEPGTVLRIEASEVFADGAFWSLEPASLTVDKPLHVVLEWKVNTAKTAAVYAGVAAVIAALILSIRRRRPAL